MVLASTADTTSLDSLAELADRVAEVAAPPVCNVHTLTPQFGSEVDQLRAEVTRFQELVTSLSLNRRSRIPSRRPSSPRPPYVPPLPLAFC